MDGRRGASVVFWLLVGMSVGAGGCLGGGANGPVPGTAGPPPRFDQRPIYYTVSGDVFRVDVDHPAAKAFGASPRVSKIVASPSGALVAEERPDDGLIDVYTSDGTLMSSNHIHFGDHLAGWVDDGTFLYCQGAGGWLIEVSADGSQSTPLPPPPGKNPDTGAGCVLSPDRSLALVGADVVSTRDGSIERTLDVLQLPAWLLDGRLAWFDNDEIVTEQPLSGSIQHARVYAPCESHPWAGDALLAVGKLQVGGDVISCDHTPLAAVTPDGAQTPVTWNGKTGDYRVAPSPDGRKIAYPSASGTGLEIANPDGSDPQTLATAAGPITTISW